MDLSPEQQLEKIRAHTVDLIPEEELLQKLRSGRPLRVKYGVDPTGPDLHIGHVVPLRKLRLFQDLGHIAVLIIGDFTGMIGDPSGRNEMRPQLTRDQVERNAAGYKEQAFKVLDPGADRSPVQRRMVERAYAAADHSVVRHHHRGAIAGAR